jgi:hypothetical protein
VIADIEATGAVEAGPREPLISTEQTRRMASSSPFAIPDRASIQSMSSAFSRLSTPRRPEEGDGAVDLPVHHRGPWGAAVGRSE